MKLGNDREMLMEVSELFIIGKNNKISIMVKSVKACVILKLGPDFKTVLLSILV